MAENLEKVSTNKSKSALELLDEVNQEFQYPKVLQSEASSVPEEIVDVLAVKTTKEGPAGAGAGVGAGTSASWAELLDEVDQEFQYPEVLQSEASNAPEEIVDVFAVKTIKQYPSGAGAVASVLKDDAVPESKTDQDILESPEIDPEDSKEYEKIQIESKAHEQEEEVAEESEHLVEQHTQKVGPISYSKSEPSKEDIFNLETITMDSEDEVAAALSDIISGK